MPRTKKQSVQSPEPVEAPPVQPTNETPTVVTKDDYNKARSVIKQYHETKKALPKRPCSAKQLEALAKGRERNKRFANKKQADQ